MGIVYVTNLEACTLTRQTARTQSGETALVSDLSQWVGLVHELAQRVGTEERVDDAGNSLCVDQVCRREHLVVTYVHTLTDGTAHTGQADRELVGQLLTDRTYTTVAQVVDIVNGSIGVDELDQIFNDLDDVLLGEHTHVRIDVEIQFLVDTIAAYITQVVTLVREEQVLEDLACTGIISRISVTQLLIDEAYSLDLRVALVFLQGLEDDIVLGSCLIILMYKNRRDTAVDDRLEVIISDLSLTLEHHLVTLSSNDLTGVLINEVLSPCSQHTCGELTTDQLRLVLLRYLHLLCEVEDLKNVLITFVTDGTQKRCHRQLLLTIDISVHDIVDVCSELNPRALERNDTCAVEHSTIGMDTLAEEHTR